ncbi:MAG: oligosaccharide flippase family protein, partial [Fibrobacter sp.]|nr:oligosaccharide flippase family protein [Fibrobacter sp.]
MLSTIKNIKIGVFISLVNFLIQGVSFAVQNFIAKNLGITHYGYFGVLQSDYLIFCALADFGMATLILAFFGKRATEGRLCSRILQLRFLCAFLSMLAYGAFAFLIRRHHPAFRGELILAGGLIFQHAFFDWFFICGAFWKRLLISKVLHSISYAAVMSIALFYFRVSSIEGIALAMVLAALPAWSFGVFKALDRRIFEVTRRSVRFFKLMFKAAFPYALASLASFMYLPAGLYAVDRLAEAEYLSAYNFAHKIVLLASGFMVHFISSNLIVLHREKASQISLRNHAGFILFIAFAASPLYLFPERVLSILFFAAPWNETLLAESGNVLRWLSFSLIFQAIRLPMIALLLKEKQVSKFVLFVVLGGSVNVLCCLAGLQFLPVEAVPKLMLSGE